MKRKIVSIDENKCNGCGLCVPNCQEGALQIIDGKARLISDLFCDGLGACLGHCPEGAIKVEEREAEPFDEKKVMENKNMKECSCPGSRALEIKPDEKRAVNESGSRGSQLRQWPIQLHLVNPLAPYFKNKDVLLAADCVAYAVGDFHKDFLKGKSLIIACPKLDEGRDIYVEKIKLLIDESNIKTLTVMIMEVPCCVGLVQIAQEVTAGAKRKIPIKQIVVALNGDILNGGTV